MRTKLLGTKPALQACSSVLQGQWNSALSAMTGSLVHSVGLYRALGMFEAWKVVDAWVVDAWVVRSQLPPHL